MPRSTGKTVTITVNTKDGTVDIPTANAVGAPCTLKFVLTGGGSWGDSPYITIANGGTVFGTPVLTGNTVTVSDANADNTLYNYTVSYNPPPNATVKLLSFDPEIQNSNSN